MRLNSYSTFPIPVHLLAFFSRSVTGSNHIQPHQADSSSCGFDGNPDIYGLGIRIGFYVQFLAVWLSHLFVLSEAKASRSVNLVYIFAVFIGLVWLSHDPTKCHAVEAFMLNMLFVVAWRVGVIETPRFGRKYWRVSPVNLLVQDFMFIALLAYTAWYFWLGLDLMKKTPCGTYVFFFAKVDLFGWYRVFLKCVIVLDAILTPFLIASHLILAWVYWYTKNIRGKAYFDLLRENLLQNLAELAVNNRTGSIDLEEAAINIALPASPTTYENEQDTTEPMNLTFKAL